MKFTIIFKLQLLKTIKTFTFKALTPPSSPVPLPKGMRGISLSLHSLATLLTSSVVWGKTTTSGMLVLNIQFINKLLNNLPLEHFKFVSGTDQNNVYGLPI